MLFKISWLKLVAYLKWFWLKKVTKKLALKWTWDHLLWFSLSKKRRKQ